MPEGARRPFGPVGDGPAGDTSDRARRFGARRLGLTAVVVGVLLLAGACSRSSTDDVAAPGKGTTTTVEAPPANVTSTVSDGATDVPLTAPIGLTVDHGRFSKVAIAPASTAASAPDPGEGVSNADRTGWLSPSDFAPHTPYVITATVSGTDGKSTTHSWKFTTGAAKAELHTTTNVGDGSSYGVGMPIIVTLNTPVPQALHKAVTDRMKVTSTPQVEGAWRWFSDTEVHYRPSVYWPAHTSVQLAIDFAGLNIGNGVWGVDGRTVNFSIGDARVTMVDSAAHTMTVTLDGKVVNTFPVSTGSDRFPTHSGIHVVNEKAQKVVMDSATVGIPRNSPDGYYETVYWDVRISNSGEFVHAAPWSQGAQGSANVSHGCVNASDADAEWFYNFSQIGDVVAVVNTPLQLQPWNGYGDWQIPWDQWAN